MQMQPQQTLPLKRGSCPTGPPPGRGAASCLWCQGRGAQSCTCLGEDVGFSEGLNSPPSLSPSSLSLSIPSPEGASRCKHPIDSSSPEKLISPSTISPGAALRKRAGVPPRYPWNSLSAICLQGMGPMSGESRVSLKGSLVLIGTN